MVAIRISIYSNSNYFIIFLLLEKLYMSGVQKIICLEKTKEEVIGQENVSVLVETKMRDTRQNVVGTSEQYVPGVKTTYREYYTCKNCGNTFTQDYTKRTPKV